MWARQCEQGPASSSKVELRIYLPPMAASGRLQPEREDSCSRLQVVWSTVREHAGGVAKV